MAQQQEVEPQSVAADKEPELKVRVFDVLKLDTPVYEDGGIEHNRWVEVGPLEDVYLPLPQEIGEAFGEGSYMLIERDDRYSFRSVYTMRVVAEKRYRQADDGE